MNNFTAKYQDKLNQFILDNKEVSKNELIFQNLENGNIQYKYKKNAFILLYLTTIFIILLPIFNIIFIYIYSQSLITTFLTGIVLFPLYLIFVFSTTFVESLISIILSKKQYLKYLFKNMKADSEMLDIFKEEYPLKIRQPILNKVLNSDSVYLAGTNGRLLEFFNSKKGGIVTAADARFLHSLEEMNEEILEEYQNIEIQKKVMKDEKELTKIMKKRL